MGRGKREINTCTMNLSFSPETYERLRAAGKGIVGGCSRVADDCLRACLPLYASWLSGKGKVTNIESGNMEFDADLILSVLVPEMFGKAIAVAIHEKAIELMEIDVETDSGKSKGKGK